MKNRKQKVRDECAVCNEEKGLCEPVDCDELVESKEE